MTGSTSVQRRPVRIGAVTYLNTKPLVSGLTGEDPDIELVFDYPSRLADRLRQGSLDVALIPSIEYLRNPSYRIVSDACIACRGPVLSVKLLSRVPMRSIQTLALDAGSRTSGVLARILLWERFQLRPRLEMLPIDVPPEDSSADAVLVIGDRAIHAPPKAFADWWDLGAEWCRWSGLPFVFALWGARADIPMPHVAERLARARDSGQKQLREIARIQAETVGLSESQVYHYLRDNLHFYLGERERRGMEMYFARAKRLDLDLVDLESRLDDCTTS